MDVLSRLNEAAAYIEAHLGDEIDLNELSRITLYTPDGFSRLFSYMAGMTLREYVRRRRLTLAAYELRETGQKVIDVAVKYGYDSADAFTKAFIRQHGKSPTKARVPGAPLRVCSPVSFYIAIKGAKEMEFRIMETGGIRLKGLSRQFKGSAADRFEQEHILWATECDDATGKICREIPGVWYGIWDRGVYRVGKAENEVDFEGLDAFEIPGGTYAVFTTDSGGFAGDELPRLRESVDVLLDDAGYVQTGDYEVEVYHLYPKTERRKRYYEMWIPVLKRG